MSRNIRFFCSIIAIALFMIAVAGCGSRNDSVAPENDDYYDEQSADKDYTGGFDSSESTDDSDNGIGGSDISDWLNDQKIIRNVFLSLEVETFDEAYSYVKTLVANDGFIQSENISTSTKYSNNKPVKVKSGTIVLRIAKDKLDSILDSIGNIGEVTRQESGSQNITAQYIDKEARIELLNDEKDRLNVFLQKEQSPEIVFQYQSRITQILYEIEKLKGDLQKWDNLVEFSTVTVYMAEKVPGLDVNPYDDSFFDKLWKSFKEALIICESIIIFIIGALPVLILAGAFIILIIFINKKIRPRKG